MNPSKLSLWDWAIFSLCLAPVLWIGWKSRRRWSSANDYLNASRSLPLWAVALAFLAYNCGSIEVIGMSAMAAQYGVQALHFYWIGGIPGLLFVGLVVLPVYMRTGARSLPEYLGMRFGPRVRLLNACISMIAAVCFAGVALYTIAQVLAVIAGSSFLPSALLCASIVLAYVLAGGVRASIFTSVFQLFVMIAGIAPLVFLTVRFDAATWARRAERWHLWQPLPLFSPHAPLDCFGVVVGLGFVISFSFWCTDFVMVQRALTARTVEEARKVPLLAGFGKMGIAFLVVLPGVAAPKLLGGVSFDRTMPALMALEFGPALLALGTAALLAGLMAWLAGNVSGFAALWAEEIYRKHLCPGGQERAVIRAGRIAVPVCLALAQLAAYATFCFRDIMEFLQLIVAFCYAPVFAAVLSGMLSRRVTERGALCGICGGVASAVALQTAYWAGIARFGSQMNANFYEAAVGFTVAMAFCLALTRISHSPRKPVPPVSKPAVVGVSKPPLRILRRANRHFLGDRRRCEKSRLRKHRAKATPSAVVFDAAMRSDLRLSPSLLLLSTLLLGLCAILNLVWW